MTVNYKETSDKGEIKQKTLEYLILLVLGAVDRPVTLIHLQKEVFLLWNFHSFVRKLTKFVKHYKGPFSREISETIQNPMFLRGYWEYIPPDKDDDISGGIVKLTEVGKKEYEKIAEKMRTQEKYRHLLSGIKMVRELYDNLTPEELLLLIYDTYPEYSEKSIIFKRIFSKRKILAQKLYRNKLIDKKRFEELVT